MKTGMCLQNPVKLSYIKLHVCLPADVLLRGDRQTDRHGEINVRVFANFDVNIPRIELLVN